MDFVQDNTPLLIGLEIIDKYGLQVLSVENKPQCVPGKWSLPLHRKDGHVRLSWDTSINTYYTRSQLQRLQRHMMHRSVQKMYTLLRRAHAEDLPPDTRRILEKISEDRQACHRNAPRPLKFKLRDADKLQFNHELLLDIMYLHDEAFKQRLVLHMIDAGTRFTAAAFLPAIDVDTVRNNFVKACSSLYVGFPDSMLKYQGFVFISSEWNGASRASALTPRHTGTKSATSTGLAKNTMTHHAEYIIKCDMTMSLYLSTFYSL